ncbi:MAG: alkaline phosphatase family protein [Chromatiales bacterium]|nr:alkaline phosphatase family protein [Chromatiales bacterium]
MFNSTLCLPRYRQGSIVNLMSSLLAGVGGIPDEDYPPLPRLPAQRIAAHRNVVLIVVDGLGDRWLATQADARWLNAHRQEAITSVFPSTTATAITTYLTGQAPQQHGLTGWHVYLRELAAVMSVLPGRARYGGVPYSPAGVDARALFGHTSVFERCGVETCMVSPRRIASSDFTLAHAGPARIFPYDNLDGMQAAIEKAARGWFWGKARRFIYAYWPDLDSLGHRFGMHSDQAATALLAIDRTLQSLADRLSGSDTLLVVCADHGQIDSPPQRNLDLDNHPELHRMLALPLCGEPRVAYAYVRAHCGADFEQYVESELGQCAQLKRSEELVNSAWFGLGQPNPELHSRIGDYTLLLRENYTLRDWLPQEKRYTQIGTHGGLTEDEMLVPLIVAEV